MGSFNHTGNFSHLPILYGDRIVVLIGIKTVETNSDINHMAPGLGFTPVFTPIRGIYDDYGAIKNIDQTDAIKLLEDKIGMSAEKLVRIAERNEAGCSSQEEEDNKDIIKKISELAQDEIDTEKQYFGYIIEHEDIFDKLVSISNCKVKDKNFTTLPAMLLQEMGYVPEKIEKNEMDKYMYLWKHPKYPTLKQDCYIWLENEYKDYSHTIHTFSDLFKKINYENIPDIFNQSYYETVFINDIKEKAACEETHKELLKKLETASNEERIHISLEMLRLNRHEAQLAYTFDYRCDVPGLFSHYIVETITDYLCCIFDIENKEHLMKKYMKDFVDLASFMITIKTLSIPWGTTTYAGQEMHYKKYIDFSKYCYEFISGKYEKYKEEWEEENGEEYEDDN